MARRTSKFGPPVTGGRHHTVWNSRESAADAIKKKLPVGVAYAIANAGKTKEGRSRMAKKAAATRKRNKR
jgi:hypothetical protein